jgi:hypothetical protein
MHDNEPIAPRRTTMNAVRLFIYTSLMMVVGPKCVA